MEGENCAGVRPRIRAWCVGGRGGRCTVCERASGCANATLPRLRWWTYVRCARPACREPSRHSASARASERGTGCCWLLAAVQLAAASVCVPDWSVPLRPAMPCRHASHASQAQPSQPSQPAPLTFLRTKSPLGPGCSRRLPSLAPTPRRGGRPIGPGAVAPVWVLTHNDVCFCWRRHCRRHPTDCGAHTLCPALSLR